MTPATSLRDLVDDPRVEEMTVRGSIVTVVDRGGRRAELRPMFESDELASMLRRLARAGTGR